MARNWCLSASLVLLARNDYTLDTDFSFFFHACNARDRGAHWRKRVRNRIIIIFTDDDEDIENMAAKANGLLIA